GLVLSLVFGLCDFFFYFFDLPDDTRNLGVGLGVLGRAPGLLRVHQPAQLFLELADLLLELALLELLLTGADGFLGLVDALLGRLFHLVEQRHVTLLFMPSRCHDGPRTGSYSRVARRLARRRVCGIATTPVAASLV